MDTEHTKLMVWQWNCRGFQKKKGHLQLLIQHVGNNQPTHFPDIIALQETNCNVKLPGYKEYNQLGASSPPAQPSWCIVN